MTTTYRKLNRLWTPCLALIGFSGTGLALESGFYEGDGSFGPCSMEVHQDEGQEYPVVRLHASSYGNGLHKAWTEVVLPVEPFGPGGIWSYDLSEQEEPVDLQLYVLMRGLGMGPLKYELRNDGGYYYECVDLHKTDVEEVDTSAWPALAIP